VQRSRSSGDPSFLTPIDLELQFAEPVQSAEELTRVVEGVLSLGGVSSVRSDGNHIVVVYDSQRVLPERIRVRLLELDHPAVAGTEVQIPGVAAD
jgi:hypothetical protein